MKNLLNKTKRESMEEHTSVDVCLLKTNWIHRDDETGGGIGKLIDLLANADD